MLKSHMGWDAAMPAPRGGNRHKTDIGDLWIQLHKCRTDYALKCNKTFCEENTKTCAVVVAGGAAVWGLLKTVGRCGLVLIGGT